MLLKYNIEVIETEFIRSLDETESDKEEQVPDSQSHDPAADAEQFPPTEEENEEPDEKRNEVWCTCRGEETDDMVECLHYSRSKKYGEIRILRVLFLLKLMFVHKCHHLMFSKRIKI